MFCYFVTRGVEVLDIEDETVRKYNIKKKNFLFLLFYYIYIFKHYNNK